MTTQTTSNDNVQEEEARAQTERENLLPNKTAVRIAAADVIARAAHKLGVNPYHIRFRPDILRVTAAFVKFEEDGKLPPEERLNFAYHCSFGCTRSEGHWTGLVRRRWPVPLSEHIPQVCYEPLQTPGTSVEDHPATPAVPATNKPTRSERATKSDQITRQSVEHVDVLTLVNSCSYIPHAVAEIVGGKLSQSGYTNEIVDVIGYGTTIDVKIKHAYHASEISQFVRNMRADWILDAHIRDVDSFGLPPLTVLDDGFALLAIPDDDFVLLCA